MSYNIHDILSKSMFLPTYNEKENIEKMVRKVFSLSLPLDLLIIEDNSPDGTADIVKKLQKEYSEKLHIIERKGKFIARLTRPIP